MLKADHIDPAEYSLRCSELYMGDDCCLLTWFERFVKEEEFEAAMRLLDFPQVVRTLRDISFLLTIASGETKLLNRLYATSMAYPQSTLVASETLQLLVEFGFSDVVTSVVFPAIMFSETSDMYADGKLLESPVCEAFGQESNGGVSSWLSKYSGKKGDDGVLQARIEKVNMPGLSRMETLVAFLRLKDSKVLSRSVALTSHSTKLWSR